MEKLFDEFDQVSLNDWIQKIEKDLKGKSLDVLKSNPEHDLEVIAYHHGDSKVSYQPLSKSSGDWTIRISTEGLTNKQILDHLNEGVTGLSFEYNSEFNEKSKGVLFEHIWSDIHFSNLKNTIGAKVPEQSRLNCDIFSKGAVNGTWPEQKGDFAQFVKSFPSHKTIGIRADLFGEAGATTVQELGIACALVNEYIELLKNDFSLEEINQKLVVYLSVNDNYFVNISKFNVIRNLIAGIFKAHDENHNYQEIELVAVTSQRYMAQNDANTNLLRQTTQAMSAILGGCNALTVAGFQEELYQRMAKNISLILKEESYLDKVTNPTEGSYFLQELSHQILEKSWAWFKEIESAGGYCSALEQNRIQNAIEESANKLIQQVNEGKRTFLGVNKFQSTLEDWKDVQKQNTHSERAFKAIALLKLEECFTNNVEA